MVKRLSATVDSWVRESDRRLEAVFKESTQRVIEDAQLPRSKGGRMRVDTGFLRASGKVSHKKMPKIKDNARPREGKTYSPDPYSLEIAKTKIGQTLYFGYTASYADDREYGANGQAPDGFLRGAVRKWQQIVNRVVSELKAKK
jgi:hypothetical protein